MTYRFKLNEPIAKGASRIGLEQIDVAEARLASRDDIATAIHDARRCLKRLRALLRLIRPALTESIYRREANRVAGIGRLLAGARDHHVMQLTLAKIETRFSALPKTIGVRLNKLMANGAGPGGSARASARERRQALDGLKLARAFFARLDRRDIAFGHLAEGVERSYRRARRAFREAYDNPGDEAFHEWRKTVQQHWRHMQLLSRGWPEMLGGRASEAKELSRLLGEEHDLHVLLAFATDRGKAVLSAEDTATLTTVCQSAQAELRDLAKPRGTRLFAEPAGDLSERIALYWSAACDLSALAPPKDQEPAPEKKLARRRAHAARPTQAAVRERTAR